MYKPDKSPKNAARALELDDAPTRRRMIPPMTDQIYSPFNRTIPVQVYAKDITVGMDCRKRNGHPNDANANNDRAVQVTISTEGKDSVKEGNTEQYDTEMLTWERVGACTILKRDTMIDPDDRTATPRARTSAELIAHVISITGLDNIIGKLRIVDDFVCGLKENMLPGPNHSVSYLHQDVMDKIEKL
ncbi:MAG: hypothetical protein ABIJ10_06765 [Candidatus Micrarchaeota archaeon]|nr:hypothetical protein [Candidatus Micrarchaeota archaeon]MBU1886464.1 hypothetical protein [Candidatus Micrarchaeota archaeon]